MLRDSSLIPCRLSTSTGHIGAIAAGTATAGHIFAFQWTSTTKIAYVHRIKARWQTNNGPTAEQLIGLDVVRCTGFSALHTGGTAITVTSHNLLLDAVTQPSGLVSAMVSDTAALTDGTQVLDTEPMGIVMGHELATGATVKRGAMDLDIDFGRGGHGEMTGRELMLRNETGFVIRNRVLMGASLSAFVVFDVEWTEKDIAGI